MKQSELPRNSAGDRRATRLSQLSEEVARIAATLAALAADDVPDLKRVDADAAGKQTGQDKATVQAVQNLIDARQLRYKFFGADLFADPAWDMLLELLRAEIEQHRVTVSSLTRASNVPATTALRWIKIMTDRGLLNRSADPTDARRIFLELSPTSSLAMRAYFHDFARLDQATSS